MGKVYRLLHGDKTLQPQDPLSSLGSFESLILVAVALPYLRRFGTAVKGKGETPMGFVEAPYVITWLSQTRIS